MRPFHDARGFTLPIVIIGMVAVMATVAFLSNYFLTSSDVTSAQEEQAAADINAEAAVRTMLDRVTARAEEELGWIDASTIEALNEDVEDLELEEGLSFDLEMSGYALSDVRDDVFIPHDERALRVVTDHIRTDPESVPEGADYRAVRTFEVTALATVEGPRDTRRSAIGRVTIARTANHQRALEVDGDYELCVSAGSELIVDGSVRAAGPVSVTCDGTVRLAGELSAFDGVEVAEGADASLAAPSGAIALEDLEVGDDPEETLEAFGGRMRLLSSVGGAASPAPFASADQAGSGECPDFDDACDGKGFYSPSLTLFKSNSATSPGFDAEPGYAYERAFADGTITEAELASRIDEAVEYVYYPFPDGPQGQARTYDGSYWNGLFPDPRREAPCTADVDGASVDSYRCDTNAYGYVIDLARLGAIPGGLLTIRQSQADAGTLNPSGHQEVAVIENARALASPVTIHSEIPVYFVGSFNDVSRVAAMVDAPSLHALPEDYDRQLESRRYWDDLDGTGIEPLRSSDRHTLHAVLRSNYPLSDGSDYYGGTVESIPHVTGDFSQAAIQVTGALEGRPEAPGDPGSFQAAFAPYGATPVTQPYQRVVEFDRDLGFPDYQPPGSWHPDNFPTDGEPAGRTEERQAQATGGNMIVRLTQEPTRLPRAEAREVAGDELECPECIGDVSPPEVTGLTCTPDPAETDETVTCTATGTDGDFEISQFEFNMGDGTRIDQPNSGGQAQVTHSYDLPGSQTVSVVARDTEGYTSARRDYEIEITPVLPAVVSASCSPGTIQRDEWADCTIEASEGTFSIAEFHWDWDDGDSTSRPSGGPVELESHSWDDPGTYTVEMWVEDHQGYTSETETATVEVTRIPPEIASVSCPSTVEPAENFSCTVNLDGDDPDDGVEVNWADGTPSQNYSVSGGSASASHAYHTGNETAAEDDTYNATFYVENDGGSDGPVSRSISVETVLPTAAVSCSPTSIYDGESTSCSYSGSGPSTFNIVDRELRRTAPSGGTTVEASRSGTGTNSRSVTLNQTGTHSFRTRLVDERGNVVQSSSQSVSVQEFTASVNVSCSYSSGPFEEGESTTASCTATPNPTSGTGVSLEVTRGSFTTECSDSGSSSASCSWSKHTSSTGTYSITAEAEVYRSGDTSDVLDTDTESWSYEVEQAGPDPSISCSVSPNTVEEGDSATLYTYYDTGDSDISGTIDREIREGWTTVTSAPSTSRSGSGTLTRSAYTSEEGSYTGHVSISTTYGSDSGTCSYTVEEAPEPPAEPLEVDIDYCNLDPGDEVDEEDDLYVNCGASANKSGVSYSWGGPCSGQSGSTCSASLDTSSDGSYTETVSVTGSLDGASDSDSESVSYTVKEEEEYEPLASFTHVSCDPGGGGGFGGGDEHTFQSTATHSDPSVSRSQLDHDWDTNATGFPSTYDGGETMVVEHDDGVGTYPFSVTLTVSYGVDSDSSTQTIWSC